MKKTVAYYRSSTDLQEHSIEMQRSKAMYTSLERRIIIDEEFVDEKVSARKHNWKKRPALQQLVAQIEQGIIENLVVYKRDRLARNLGEHLQLYELFKQHNIHVFFTSENEVHMYYTPIGEYLETILGAMAEHEGKQIQQRIIEAKVSSFLDGNYAGNLPYGYTKGTEEDDDLIVQVPSEIQVVDEIFQSILSKRFETIQELCAHLNAKGLVRKKKPRKSSLQSDENQELIKKWDTHGIRTVVQNMLYMGTRIVHFNHIGHMKKYENLAVVTEEDWNKANVMLEQMAPERKRANNFRFPLQKFLLCYECKLELKARKRMIKGEFFRVLRCENEECVSKPEVWLKDVEEQVLEQAQHFFESLLDNHFQQLYERQQKQNIEKVKKMIHSHEEKIRLRDQAVERATKKWLNTPTAEHEERMKETFQELKQLKQELTRYYKRLDGIESFGKQLQENRPHYTPTHIKAYPIEVQEELYGELLDTIFISKEEIHIYFKHPFVSPKGVFLYE